MLLASWASIAKPLSCPNITRQSNIPTTTRLKLGLKRVKLPLLQSATIIINEPFNHLLERCIVQNVTLKPDICQIIC